MADAGKGDVRITFQLPETLDSDMRDAIGNRRGASQSAFIRDAIREKVDRGKRNPDTELLIAYFAQLNDAGREWLLQCAQIAADCDTTRIISPRARKADQTGDSEGDQ